VRLSVQDPVYCSSIEVLKPRSQIEIPNRFQNRQGLKKCPPKLEGPKTIQDLNHTLLLLYLSSPESWVPTNLGPKSQRPSFKLLTGVRTVKEPNVKKKSGMGRAVPKVCGTAGVSIKPGRWWSPISPRRLGSRAINQALCHRWTGTGPVCFWGLSPTPARVPELGCLFPFFL
jgi:hypothetical protein